ncbi:hypothetical protein GW930_00765 [Candidatus Saccharibacteria bacterium]|nr:hypothetical protein [Candidatus Saccharibacteria bacterium]
MLPLEKQTSLTRTVRSSLLVDELENGMQEFGRLAGTPHEKDFQLRSPLCDLASVALSGYLSHLGHDAQLLISNSEGLADVEVDHVIVRSGETIIDPTFSQFLYFAGLDCEYVRQTGEDAFPTEKIAVFDVSDPRPAIDTLVASADAFSDKDGGLLGRNGYTAGYQVDDAKIDEFRAILEGIWNSDNYHPFTPSAEVRNIGASVTKHLVEYMPPATLQA